MVLFSIRSAFMVGALQTIRNHKAQIFSAPRKSTTRSARVYQIIYTFSFRLYGQKYNSFPIPDAVSTSFLF